MAQKAATAQNGRRVKTSCLEVNLATISKDEVNLIKIIIIVNLTNTRLSLYILFTVPHEFRPENFHGKERP